MKLVNLRKKTSSMTMVYEYVLLLYLVSTIYWQPASKFLGCPLTLNRYALKSHLQSCPASLVFCNKEWNRWPVYSPERKARVPFSEHQYMARYGQLDVALALRDQRMLKRAMKAPRSTRYTLLNALLRKLSDSDTCTPQCLMRKYDSTALHTEGLTHWQSFIMFSAER